MYTNFARLKCHTVFVILQVLVVHLPEAGAYRLTTYGQEDGKLYLASVHRIVRKMEEKVSKR